MATAVGSTALKLQPGFPKWDFTADRVACTLLFKGLIADCNAQRPTVGSTMPEYGLNVERAQVYGAPAGAGYLYIELSNEDTASSAQESQEIEWAVSEIDLRLHPRYQSGGASALTTADLVQLRMWEEAPDHTLRAAFKFRSPVSGAVVTLSTNAQHIALRWLRGLTHYIVPHPIGRISTLTRSTPNTTQCGKRVSKPFSALPDNYTWLGTADRALRNGKRGKWRRDREYTGADYWDPDIYPSST